MGNNMLEVQRRLGAQRLRYRVCYQLWILEVLWCRLVLPSFSSLLHIGWEYKWELLELWAWVRNQPDKQKVWTSTVSSQYVEAEPICLQEQSTVLRDCWRLYWKMLAVPRPIIWDKPNQLPVQTQTLLEYPVAWQSKKLSAESSELCHSSRYIWCVYDCFSRLVRHVKWDCGVV